MKIFRWEQRYSQLSEVQLVKRAMKKDDLAFLELMRRYENYFIQMAYRYVKNEQDVMDLIQELAYRGLLNIHQLKEPKYFKTWMTRILINLAMNLWHKVELNELGEDLEAPSKGCLIEERMDLNRAIQKLRPDYQSVIKMHYFEDLSIEDISIRLQLQPNTVKSHLRRGKKALETMLKEDV